MPDDNRFEDIASQMDDKDADEADESHDSNESEASTESMTTDDAAFTFEEAEKKSVYGLPETIEEFEDELKRAEYSLFEDHGIKDVTGRELQDAALRLLSGQHEEIAQEVASRREE